MTATKTTSLSGRKWATIAEAEAMLIESPTDTYGFARCESVEFRGGMESHPLGQKPTAEDYRLMAEANQRTSAAHLGRFEAARQALRDAGYTWSDQNSRWERDGFWAEATGYSFSETTVSVYLDAGWVAWGAGHGGWLPPGSQSAM